MGRDLGCLESSQPFIRFVAGLLTKGIRLIAPAVILGMDSTSWTMLKRLVTVPNVLKEVNLVFLRKQGSADAVYRSIAPSLGDGLVSCRAQPILYSLHSKIHPSSLRSRRTWSKLHCARNSSRRFRSCSRLKKQVSPDVEGLIVRKLTVAVIVRLSSVVAEEAHRVILGDEFRVRLDELLRCIK